MPSIIRAISGVVGAGSHSNNGNDLLNKRAEVLSGVSLRVGLPRSPVNKVEVALAYTDHFKGEDAKAADTSGATLVLVGLVSVTAGSNHLVEAALFQFLLKNFPNVPCGRVFSKDHFKLLANFHFNWGVVAEFGVRREVYGDGLCGGHSE